ncbi:MAG: gliding motility-associated C-terminal domain-containing protein, partial [Saprospiraceae bacterium]|nr:gliding motility-associated C-terminal domain-containing protein [Saprospiraceae bacterium]
NPSPGNVTVSWLANDVVAGQSVADGTTIFQICFDVIGNSGAVSPLDFSGSPTSIEVTDAGGLVSPVFEDGSVTVTGGGGGSTDLTFILPDVTACTGNICIPVTVQNFDNIVSAQYSINYTSSILSYTGSQNYGLPGVGGSNVGNPSAGNITFSWVADDVVNGQTVADGTVIFEICFDVNGSNGQVSPLNFSGTPTSVEVSTPNGLITPVFDGGQVEVDCVGGGTDITFIAPNLTANNGDNICVPITVENFAGVVSAQYSINYNPAILSYTGSQNYGLPGVGGSNIGNPSAGNITFSWVADDVVNGETVADGTIIFEVCFDVIGSSGQTSLIDFSGNPTGVEVSTTSGIVTPVFDDGQVSVMGGGGGPSPFLLIIDDILVENGDDFCLSITAEGFTDMVSMQFSINYDPTSLQYTNSGNYQLAGMGGSNVGNPSAGNITVSWVADNVVDGETLPDGSVLFDICFTAIGPNCSASQVEFSGTPTSIEISNTDGLVTFDGEDGLVNICDGDPPAPFMLIASDELVGAGESVCVDISVTGFNDIVSMQGSINYNPTIIQFTGAQNLNLPGLVPANIANPSAGNITFSWISDDPVNGQSVPDDQIIFQLCFDAIGNLGDISPINFSGVPTSEEYSDINGMVSPILVDGSVEIFEEVCVPINVSDVIVDPCPGTQTGSINLTVSGGNDAYSYSWDYNGATSQDLNNLPAGSYTVTITSCVETFTQTYVVSDLPGISVTGEFVTDVACFGGASGAIFLNVSGTQPLTFSWVGNGPISNPNNQNLINLEAGNYTLTITDGNGCTLVSGPYEVDQPNSALSAQVTNVNDVTCAGDNDGSISLAVSGGTPSYSYDWTPSLPNTPSPNGIAGAIYSVDIQDNNGCALTIPNIQVEEPNPIVITVDVVQNETAAGEDGSISVSVSGGTGSLNYLWTGPDTDAPFVTQDISNLIAGFYNLLVTDINGCQEELTVEVIKPLTVEIVSVTSSCFGEMTGGIDVSISGGCEPYIVSYSGPGNPVPNANGDLENIAGGTYTVMVEDCMGDQVSFQINVFEPATAVGLASFVVDDVSSLGNCDGSISVVGMGGSAPYMYSWSNGPGGTNNNGLCVGSYQLTITDVNGCTFDTSFVVSYVPPPLVEESNVPVDVACFGDATGGWYVQVEGGCPPYEFNFSDIGVIVSNDGDVTRVNLPAGDYCVTVTDNCNTVQEVVICTTVDQLPPIEITNVVISPNTTGSNGAINISVQGGDFPFNYQWDNGSNAQDPVNQLPGCQQVVITDDSDCVLVSDPICIPTLEIEMDQVNDVFCSSDSDGSATVNVLGGINPPLTLNWFDAGGNPVAADSNYVENLAPGTYTVVVTDNLGVTSLPISITIDYSSDIIASAEAITPPAYNGFNVSCADSEDGSATATGSNGQAPYGYVWCDGLGAGNVLDNIGAGTYCVVVTDQLGCVDTATVTLNAPAPIQIIDDALDVPCYGESTGRAQVKVFGGVEPYLYSWDDIMAQPTNPAILLEAGDYTVTVTDANGCTSEQVSNVNQPDSLTVSLIITDDSGAGDGTVVAIVSGGTDPFNFDWNTGDDGSFIEDLKSGEYYVIVTDENGCEATAGGVVYNGSIDCLKYREVISPDGDGKNEELIINCNLLYETNRLEIYNRWGQLVYQVDQYDNTWAGKTQGGEDVPDGVYYFIFEYEDLDGQFKQMKGHVTVLR